MKNIVTTLNKDYNEMFEFDDEITYNEELDCLECYAFFFTQEKGEDYVISFNEELPTSLLINIALFIIPWLSNALNSEVRVIPCSYVQFDEDGKYKKTLMEEEYVKVIEEG